MICDECREETGKFTAKDKDGKVRCAKCVKASQKKPSRKVKSKDPFIRLCRELSNISMGSADLGENMAINSTGKRAFTNGHVLLSETISMPKMPTTADLVTLKTTAKQLYPNIKKLLSEEIDGYVVDVPEEFYRSLKAFNPKVRSAYVNIRVDGFHVYERHDEAGMVLDYGGADTSKVSFVVTFDAAYLMALKPGRIRVGKDDMSMCRFEKCYVKGTENLKHIVAMPVGQD